MAVMSRWPQAKSLNRDFSASLIDEWLLYGARFTNHTAAGNSDIHYLSGNAAEPQLSSATEQRSQDGSLASRFRVDGEQRFEQVQVPDQTAGTDNAALSVRPRPRLTSPGRPSNPHRSEAPNRESGDDKWVNILGETQ
jgi:hypothetical protein